MSEAQKGARHISGVALVLLLHLNRVKQLLVVTIYLAKLSSKKSIIILRYSSVGNRQINYSTNYHI